MRKPMLQILVYALMTIICLMASCKDQGEEPPPPTNEKKKWEEIALFKNTDIMYMLQHKGVLYVSAILKERLVTDSASMLFTTIDGENWDTLKIFDRQIGPLAFNGDTLTVLVTGETWKYHPSFGWKMFWKHLIDPTETRDMFYLNGELFVFTYRYFAYSEDTIREITTGINKMSKFMKHKRNGNEVAYTRPYYVYDDDVTWFDGDKFHSIMNGISPNENSKPNYPSLLVHEDTLYAGFNTPSRIKKLINDVWVNVTDSIENTKDAYLFNPPLKNRPSVILFHNNRMIVGTERTGILEWTNTGWVSLSNGLRKQFPDYPSIEIYTSVIFLEYFNGYLFTGYGEPWFAPTDKGRGIYRYKLD